MGKSGVLEHKSGNISETSKDTGKVTMKGLYEVTNALSNGTAADPLQPPLPQDRGSQLPKLQSLLSPEALGLRTSNYIHRDHPNKRPFKVLEKRERGRIQGLPKFFEYRKTSIKRRVPNKRRVSNKRRGFGARVLINAGSRLNAGSQINARVF